MVRSAFGAQRGIGPGGGSANPKFSSAQTSALLPSCEKISLVRGDRHPPQQPLRFELQFGSLLGAKLDNARLMLKVSAGAVAEFGIGHRSMDAQGAPHLYGSRSSVDRTEPNLLSNTRSSPVTGPWVQRPEWRLCIRAPALSGQCRWNVLILRCSDRLQQGTFAPR